MKRIGKATFPLLLLLVFFTACTSGPTVETLSPASLPTESALELLAPEPLSEGSPLTLAGEGLYSAVMMDAEEAYGFSGGTAANLEGWFQLLGFQAEEPFYEYYDLDGTLRLTLWYDPESGVGLGIRYCGGDAYGFGFRSTGQAVRRDTEEEPYGKGWDWAYGWYRWEDDPFTLPSYDASEVPDYEERREWDEEGRLTSLASYGTLEYWPPVKENPLPLWEFTYDYDEQGVLRHRRVFSHYTFYTTNPGQNGYYDDQGRLAYEDGYITHGSTDTYYIYKGDAKKPSYALYLDQSHQYYYPDFVCYP